jgi:GTP-binding protein HflX
LFFERPKSGEITVLVSLDVRSEGGSHDISEFQELALSAGAHSAAVLRGTRREPAPKHFLGRGKLEELRSSVLANSAELVLFNHILSPSQERNLERELKCKVLDRTGLILDIFAQRARSHEGKLQVELAQLQHLSTRLKGGWSHLDRQKGGIGMRGAGETQLEIDHRLIGHRIKAIRKGLEKVHGRRGQSRRSRAKAQIPTVSLVGYTNAGKSALFNTVTQSNVFAANQLFATLDSTLRRFSLPHFGPAILADTVGFISKLPHQLIEAFKATLEETVHADLLLHVIDCSNTQYLEFVAEVESVLSNVGADEVKQLKVFNKIDLVSDFVPRLQRAPDGKPEKVWVSAKTGAGLDLLYEAVSELLADELVRVEILLGPTEAKLRSRLYTNNYVEKENINENGEYRLKLKLPAVELKRIEDSR